MKKKYISPRILIEKMDLSLLVDTSMIRFIDTPKPLDAKGFYGDVDDEDTEEYWWK